MRYITVLFLILIVTPAGAGLVMNENTDTLPPGCDEIQGWKNITIHAGREYAHQFNGKVFTYDNRSLSFEGCQRLTVTFVNNDSVRHQWMIHGLPRELYPGGMFTIEVTGPGRDKGTFILPSTSETFKVHCGVPQHAQKGMKAQIKVNGGDGNIPNVPGITDAYDEYEYPRESPLLPGVILAAVGALLGAGLVTGYRQWAS
ncbi:MAG: cupredoxin domain-containing protein [Candidatus Nanohaloarchaea archaeon]|nr:cupredoxin domain-containing protein [Candidatus Nanohaloarchaea archaeon]